MQRIKERRKILHIPSTHEIFLSLKGMTKYSNILANHNTDKPYIDFLRWLIERNFYETWKEKITIKKIATDYKTENTKVTRWLKEIYGDIFVLNYEKPDLFYGGGTKVCLFFNHNDNYQDIFTFLPVIPREFETVRFPFVKSKLGIDYFWVKRVEHEIFDEVTVTIWLQGGFGNKYREFTLE